LNLWNLPSFESNTQILTSFLEISIACVYILSNTTLGTTGKLWVPLEVWKLEEKQQNRVFCAGALAQRVSPRQGEVLRSPAEACGILRGPAAACENLRSTGGKLRSTGRKLRSTGGKLRWLAECCGDLRDPAVDCSKMLPPSRNPFFLALVSCPILSLLFSQVVWRMFYDPKLSKPSNNH
jgi:hypothetical protein